MYACIVTRPSRGLTTSHSEYIFEAVSERTLTSIAGIVVLMNLSKMVNLFK